MENKTDKEFKICPVNKLLMVSQDGEVKNSQTGEILQQSLYKGRYYAVEDPRNKKEIELVHRLVAFTWVNSNPPKGADVHHWNSTLDNHADNLVWVDPIVHDSILHDRPWLKINEYGVDYCPLGDIEGIVGGLTLEKISGVLVLKNNGHIVDVQHCMDD
jgi:hypothetical protein